MNNPWPQISLADYEGHMSLPAIGQAAMLAAEFRRAIEETQPQSLALIGCAAGNGLDALIASQVQKIVCVDIHPSFLQVLQTRYANQIPGLECHCCELEKFELAEPLDMVFGGLIFEYTALDAATASVSRLLRYGGTLRALVQLPTTGHAIVSHSPYAPALASVGEYFSLVPPDTLVRSAEKNGLQLLSQRTVQLPSDKSFCIQDFQRLPS